MLLLNVSVVSSGINYPLVSVYKRTRAFHTMDTKRLLVVWNFSSKCCISGNLLSTNYHSTIHLRKGTQTWLIYQFYGQTNGRQCDSLGMPRIMPMYHVVCPGMNLELHIAFLQPFFTCQLLQNPTRWALPLWKCNIGITTTNISHSSHQWMCYMDHVTGFHITCKNALLSWHKPRKETLSSVFTWTGDLRQPNCSNG